MMTASTVQYSAVPACRMQPLLHRFSKRIERAARAEAAAEAAEAAALEEAAFMAGSSADSSGDETPLLQRKPDSSAAPSKGPSKQPKHKSKLKLKLKVGGVRRFVLLLHMPLDMLCRYLETFLTKNEGSRALSMGASMSCFLSAT